MNFCNLSNRRNRIYVTHSYLQMVPTLPANNRPTEKNVYSNQTFHHYILIIALFHHNLLKLVEKNLQNANYKNFIFWNFNNCINNVVFNILKNFNDFLNCNLCCYQLHCFLFEFLITFLNSFIT
jgi:hypothetical protein